MSEQGSKKARWAVMVAKPVPIYGLHKGVLISDSSIIISSRIDEFLRLRSVKAQFDTNHAEATCTTSDFLRYKIYLYAGPDDIDESTYIEIQMMGGCDYQFRKERQAIISTAKGLGTVDAAFDLSKRLTIPSNMKGLYVVPSTNELERILDKASDKFHTNDPTAILFELQNLAFMTNKKKAHPETANNLSRLVMNSRIGIQSMIVSIYTNTASDMNGEVCEELCDACLCILANGIMSLPKNECFLDQECECFIQDFVPSLVHNLERLECVHHTCLALRCLSLLADNSSLACEMLQDTNIDSIMKQAVEQGREEHLMLEKTAMSTIDLLQSKLTVA